MADLTCPVVVEKLGGRDKFIERLASMAAEIKSSGFRIDSIDMSEPPSYVEWAGDLYSILPQTLRLSLSTGIQISKHSYLAGVSPDGGATWRFIDGQGIGGDRKKMEIVLPHFPKTWRCPKCRRRKKSSRASDLVPANDSIP